MKYKYTFKDELGNVFDTFEVYEKLDERRLKFICDYWDGEKNTKTICEIEVIGKERKPYGKILDDLLNKIKMNGVVVHA